MKRSSNPGPPLGPGKHPDQSPGGRPGTRPEQAVTKPPPITRSRSRQDRVRIEYGGPVDGVLDARVIVLLQFTCPSGSEILEPAQRFIDAVSRARLGPSLAARLTVTGYELLANALAYGSVGRDVGFQIVEREDLVEVRVSNEAVPSRIDRLTERVEALQIDPQAVFLAEMRKYAAQGISRAALGLARVRHEAGMNLVCQRSGDRVTVVASTRK